MKRIIISDIHIGSKFFKEELLVKFLQEKFNEYDELILAGDIIDFIVVPVFTQRTLEIAKSINVNKPIYYIIGNHDTPLSGFVGKSAFGFNFVDKYEFEDGGRKFRVEHGDQYDHPIIGISLFMNFISAVQGCLEYWFDVNLSDLFTNYKIKKRKLRRIWDILKWNEDVDVLICGHSHIPEAVIWIDENEKIKTFCNSGDWVSHSTYVEVTDGVVRLKKYTDKEDEVQKDVF